MISFGKKLRQIRKSLGWVQKEIGHPSTVAQWEHQDRLPSSEDCRRVIRLLQGKVSDGDLLILFVAFCLELLKRARRGKESLGEILQCLRKPGALQINELPTTDELTSVLHLLARVNTSDEDLIRFKAFFENIQPRKQPAMLVKPRRSAGAKYIDPRSRSRLAR